MQEDRRPITELRSTRKLRSLSVSSTCISEYSGSGRDAELGLWNDIRLYLLSGKSMETGKQNSAVEATQATLPSGWFGKWRGACWASATCSGPRLQGIDV